MISPLQSVVLAGALAFPLAAQIPAPRADDWLVPAGSFPGSLPASLVRSNSFRALRADAVAEKIKVTWVPDHSIQPTGMTLRASLGSPGHWLARDWRSYPMASRGAQWDTSLPVEDLDEPVLYFVQAVGAGQTNLSPMRIVRPREAGLENPTQPFWPFLEGFEEGSERWQVLTDPNGFPALRTTAPGKSGSAALAVTVPAGKNSVVVATTCLRGWQLQQHEATGVRLWLRTRQRSGRVRFALLANAFTPAQTSGAWPKDVSVNDLWQQVDLYLSDLGAFRLGAVDLFTIEFSANGPAELLVDDMQLLGPWRLEP